MGQKPDFQEELRAHDFRVTSIRLRLLEALWRWGKPRTVDEVARQLDLDVVTVYRALHDFVKADLIFKVMGAGGAAHFLYPRDKHHHHMVCKECGFIKQCSTC